MNTTMNNRTQRILTALVLIPIAVLFIIYSNDFIFFVVILALILLATYEFSILVEKAGYKIIRTPILIGSLLIPFSFFIDRVDVFLFSVFIVTSTTLVIKLFSKMPLEDTFRTVGFTFLNVFYVPFYFSFIILLKNINYHYVFFLFAIIWVSDSFAYFLGSRYGKHKLYELISPKKSIEGFVAGLIGGILAGFIYSMFFMKIGFLHVIVISFLISLFGAVGDLIESMFKRKAQVKDSGHIFPGHGGMLDRIDSLLFGAPILYFYIELFL